MKRLGLLIVGAVVIALIGLAIASGGSDNETPSVAEREPESAVIPGYNGPEWTRLPLTDVRTGDSFTLADFAGKTVLVHGMATWCAPCHEAQANLRDNVIPQADENYVFISLSVESGISDADLLAYAEDDDFDWTFAVLTPEALAALTREFGAGIVTPPVRPHFIIGPTGELSSMMRGEARPERLLEELRLFSGRA